MADDGSKLHVAWRTLAITFAIVSVALGATLAIVASKANLDALSTTALALALLSFSAQLMIALVQFLAASHQQAESSRIANETSTALAQVRLVSEGVSESLRGQVDRLLDYALSDVQSQAGTPEEAEVADRLVDFIRNEIRADNVRASVPASSVGALDQGARSSGQDILRKLAASVSARGLEPRPAPIGSEADILWVGADGVTRVGLLKTTAAQHYLHSRAIERYATQTARALETVGVEGATGVLILPFEPAAADWEEVERRSGIRIVWPATFDRALDS